MIDEKVQRRFWSKVDKGQGDGCWNWTAGTNRGYGQMGLSNPRRWVKSHRISWEIHNGPIPDGLHVLHHCDNPLCVNPAHLFVGTNGDNVRDMVEKGRSLIGTRRPNAKLNEVAVRRIRDDYATGDYTMIELAEEHGVSLAAIHGVIHGRTWRHVASACAATLLLVLCAGCSMGLSTPNMTFNAAVLDRLEGSDAQLEHTAVLGLGVGSVWIGKAERSIQRIPDASDATIERTDLLNAQGQTIRTTEKTSIGQLVEELAN